MQSYTAGKLDGFDVSKFYSIAEVASTTSLALLQATSCTNGNITSQLACLRAVSASVIASLPAAGQVGLTIDGE